MKNPSILEAKERLDRLFNQVAALSDEDEMKSHLTQYLCVLVSGFIETSIQSILIEYVRMQADESVARYVESQIERRLINLDIQGILTVMGNFNPDWETTLRTQITQEMRGDIGSVRANRNKIAHGQSEPISYAPLRRYYGNAVAVIDLIETQCNP